MTAYQIIAAKRDGKRLSAEQIDYIISGYVHGTIPDYQISALLMAIYLQGMSWEEVLDLTETMIRSGDVLDLSDIPGVTVDKHSTGGVGDKVSLVLAPLVAAAGVPVPMLSGRGLGHTGGTLDKLEAIPGFRTSLTTLEFTESVTRVGLAIMGQSQQIAPADGKLYALRDVTATVSCIPLIASSIMSKKLAAGPQGLVFDVKVGQGAVLRETEMARELAGILNRIGRARGRRTVALLTDMNQPLGLAVGNALEVAEAVACLRGDGPDDLLQVTMALGEQMLILGGVAKTAQEAGGKLQQVLDSGAGLDKFIAMVQQQGGDPRAVDEPNLLPQSEIVLEVNSPQEGYINGIDARAVGAACVQLGAGRTTLKDSIDPAVGVRLRKKVGQVVVRGEVLAEVLTNDADRGHRAVEQIAAAVEVGPEQPVERPLVIDLIEDGGE